MNVPALHPSAADLQVGDIVMVKARRIDGQLAATMISKQRPPQLVITGRIESLSTDRWVIGGHEVMVNDQTQISGDPADVGDWAMAWVQRTPDGLVALRIQVRDARPVPDMVLFRGTVVTIDGGVWTVDTGGGTRTVLVDENTRIVGDIAVGDAVAVKGFVLDNGDVQALLIARLHHDQLDAQFAGFVTEFLPTPATTPPTWAYLVTRPPQPGQDGASWIILVTSDTRSNVPPGDVTVGQWVKGVGEALDDQSVVARRPGSDPAAPWPILRRSRFPARRDGLRLSPG